MCIRDRFNLDSNDGVSNGIVNDDGTVFNSVEAVYAAPTDSPLTILITLFFSNVSRTETLSDLILSVDPTETLSGIEET